MDKQDGYNFEPMKILRTDADQSFLVQVMCKSSEDDGKPVVTPAGYKEYVTALFGKKRHIRYYLCETSWVIILFVINLTLIPHLLWTFPFIVLSATMT
ncbi:hypothetical protein NXW37_29595 [Bacteroides thetaiotaomicron]|nr:hypothetical protein [Bacteroides thetaiotaomicron]